MPVSGDAHLNFGKVFGAEKTRMMRLSTSYAEENVMLRRARPSDPWFDKDCLEAKRLTRRLERAYRATCRKADIEISAVAGTSTAVRVAKDAWYAQRRNYRDLCQRKRSAFWCDTVESDRKSPRSLWRSVNQLLGRGRPPASSAISVDEFSRFFFMTKSTPSG